MYLNKYNIYIVSVNNTMQANILLLLYNFKTVTKTTGKIFIRLSVY